MFVTQNRLPAESGGYLQCFVIQNMFVHCRVHPVLLQPQILIRSFLGDMQMNWSKWISLLDGYSYLFLKHEGIL